MQEDPSGSGRPPTDAAGAEGAARRRRQRNLALALAIVGFVIIVYLVTIMRIGASVANRSF